MKKKNAHLQPTTSAMPTQSKNLAPQMRSRSPEMRRGKGRNAVAVEPHEYAKEKKTCPFCGTVDHCKYKYINNHQGTQPRYQCLTPGCRKYFALVPHNRPVGRTYRKKRGEEPAELRGLLRMCPHCGGINNASFKYYNNDKQKQGLHPRFLCLNRACNKQFQTRKVTCPDGAVVLVSTSRTLPAVGGPAVVSEHPMLLQHQGDDNDDGSGREHGELLQGCGFCVDDVHRGGLVPQGDLMGTETGHLHPGQTDGQGLNEGGHLNHSTFSEMPFEAEMPGFPTEDVASYLQDYRVENWPSGSQFYRTEKCPSALHNYHTESLPSVSQDDRAESLPSASQDDRVESTSSASFVWDFGLEEEDKVEEVVEVEEVEELEEYTWDELSSTNFWDDFLDSGG